MTPLVLFDSRPAPVGNGHGFGSRVIVGDHHGSALGHGVALLIEHLAVDREARPADSRGAQPDIDPFARLQRTYEIALGAREDERQSSMRITGQLAPVCPAGLFHVSEI